MPRSSAGNTDVIIAMPVPCVMAAPTPCTALKAMSISMLCEPAASSAAPAKTAMPARYTVFRPIMSESRPIGRISALTASPSATTTHCAADRSASKCCAIVGSATDMPPWLITEVRVPNATAENTHHL